MLVKKDIYRILLFDINSKRLYIHDLILFQVCQCLQVHHYQPPLYLHLCYHLLLSHPLEEEIVLLLDGALLPV